MILRELVALAEREGLVKDPALEEKRVDFEIRIDEDGRYLRLVSLRGADGKGALRTVPRFPKRSVDISSGFLVDNAKYVLGLGLPGRDRPERMAACQAAYATRIAEVLRLTDDPALVAAGRFCAAIEANRLDVLRDRPLEEWTGGEILLLSVEGVGPVHEQPEVRSAWSLVRGAGLVGKPVRCLVTGRVASAERLHPSIRRVPGGQSSGTTLVSFNAAAFASHGLTQGENAPVAREAALAYTTALNYLLDRDDALDRPYRQGIRLGGEAIALYWSTAPASSLGFFAELMAGRRGAAEPAPGPRPEPRIDEERFFVLTLGANAARLVIHDWFESTVGRTRASLHRYLDDLALGRDGRAPAIWELLAALDPPGNASVPPPIGARLFASALQGAPVPRELLRLALVRYRRPAESRRVDTARVALIKAALRGIGRSDPDFPHLKEVTMSLDESNPQPPYQLGRLFAALERAQLNAIGGDANATIRDRYFGAASSTPAIVFPRLLRLAQHHIAKARSDGREFGIEKQIGQIVDRLSSDGFPPLLTLEGQGLFAVGYYHQREAFFAGRKA